MLKRTCGILCSYSSIFEVLLCHINNFSSFTYFTYFNTYVKPWLWASQLQERIMRNFRIFLSRYFRIFPRNIRILYFAKKIEAKYRGKSENFRIFPERTKKNYLLIVYLYFKKNIFYNVGYNWLWLINTFFYFRALSSPSLISLSSR